jgi:hypothetical protein
MKNTLTSMTVSAVSTLLRQSTDENDEPMDKRFDVEDVPNAAWDQLQEDLGGLLDTLMCDAKYADALLKVIDDPDKAGHDFIMSRNGHGCGFWDGDWGTEGDRLHALVKPYGEMSLYVGDDGTLYV